MNGKQARKLRKQAGGNEAQYNTTQSIREALIMNKEGKFVKVPDITFVKTLTMQCSRFQYKKLKQAFYA